MSDFAADWAASRRLFLLRLLVETGEANESVLHKAALKGGFARDGRDAIRADLDHLREAGCLNEDWLDGRVRVVRITTRGEDCAHGRVRIDGVEHSYWQRETA